MHRSSVSVVCIVLLLLGSVPTAVAQESSSDVPSAKADSIRSLIRMTRGEQIAEQVFNRVLRLQKQKHPDVPDQWWSKMRENADFDGLIQQLIPIYAQHFSQREINKLLDFYRTPLGQKTIEKMPTIMQESMTVGREWGRTLQQKIKQQLKRDGHLKS